MSLHNGNFLPPLTLSFWQQTLASVRRVFPLSAYGACDPQYSRARLDKCSKTTPS